VKESRITTAAVLAAVALAAGPAAGQATQDTLRLTLDGAVARALATSEEVQTARAQRALAESQVVQARAGAYPQVAASAAYNRTLASIFDGISFGPPPGEGEEPGDDPFAGLPFGRPNVWNAGLTVTQPLYVGGRVGTALRIARDVREAADLEIGIRGGDRPPGARRLLPGGAGRRAGVHRARGLRARRRAAPAGGAVPPAGDGVGVRRAARAGGARQPGAEHHRGRRTRGAWPS
jgi:hypothetical protein